MSAAQRPPPRLCSKLGGMSGEILDELERAEIEAHAQRIAEQAALRKVRKTLDSIEESETTERRVLRKVLIVCAMLAVLGAWLVWGLLSGDKAMPKQPPMKVPGKVQPRQ